MRHFCMIRIRKFAAFEQTLFGSRWLGPAALAIVLLHAATLIGFSKLDFWVTDHAGNPVYHAFVAMWSGSYDVLHGRGSSVYDQAQFVSVQRRILNSHPGQNPYFIWVYPPTALFVVLPLALMPYTVAFVVWATVTVVLYMWAVWNIVPRAITPLVALTPLAVPINILLGQDGLLNAALLGIVATAMRSRPRLAGVCLGLLSYKPQLGLAFPVVLASAARWRIFFAAAASTLVFAVASAVWFGVSSWEHFFQQLVMLSGSDNFELAGLHTVHQSFYGLATWLGASRPLAWSFHCAGAAATLMTAIALWRRSDAFDMKSAATVLSTFAVTPFLVMYDLALLAIPAALLIRQGLNGGFLVGERTLIALCVGLEFPALQMPIGPLILLILESLVIRRALSRV